MGIKNYLEEQLRTKLSILLDIEQLQSPEQVVGFDDDSFRQVSSWELYQKSIQVTRDRKRRYLEYDRMDENADIKMALDTYAEEVTVANREKERTVWVSSESEEISEILHAMFDRIELETNLYGIARSISKYGDDFEQVLYDDTRGVYQFKYLEPNRIDRYVDDQNRLRGFKVEAAKSVAGQVSGASLAQPWDFIHFKIVGVIRDGWGESMLMGIQQSFRILEQMETALALYRLFRAADRNVFYIDVGTASTDQAYSIVEKWRQTYRKRKWFQSENGAQGAGQVEFKHNPIDLIEDIFWPVRKDSESRIEKLQGSNNVGDIADIEYFRNKVRNGLGIPPEYFGSTEGTGAYNAAAGLAAQDMRFSRKVGKIQRALINGIEKLCKIHLGLIGIDHKTVEFKVRMEPLSYLQEMQKVEAFTGKVTAAQGLVEIAMSLGFDPQATAKYVFKHLLFTSDDELNEFFALQEEAVAEQMQAQVDSAEQEKQDQSKLNRAQTQSLFAKAKGAATNKAKTMGGNSGVTVSSKKPTAKSKTKTENITEMDEIMSMLEASRKHINDAKKDKATFSGTTSIVEIEGSTK